MFGTKVEFSGLADRVDLLPVEPNPRGGRRSCLIISNEYRLSFILWNALSDSDPFSREQLCGNMGANNARGVLRLVTI